MVTTMTFLDPTQNSKICHQRRGPRSSLKKFLKELRGNLPQWRRGPTKKKLLLEIHTVWIVTVWKSTALFLHQPKNFKICIHHRRGPMTKSLVQRRGPKVLGKNLNWKLPTMKMLKVKIV